ncbi:MAG: hypothetical protein M3041_05480 [Acidobacteriota bacterium]|nr:hypothetical protein [Acidobacteriota bacterium]
MFYDWVGRHPGIFIVIAIIGVALMMMRSIVRALQRWEVIPDPLLPERWRRVVNSVQQKALEASSDPKNYSAVDRVMRGGGPGNSGGARGDK